MREENAFALLRRELLRRERLAEDDRTVARLRLREAAVLLARGEVRLPSDAPEEMFSPLRARYESFLAPVLAQLRPEDAFPLRAALVEELTPLIFGQSGGPAGENLPREGAVGGPADLAAQDSPSDLFGTLFAPSPARECVAYLPNRFSRAAMARAAAALPPLREREVESFARGAELLCAGECTALLLPHESADGHGLPIVEELIDSCALKKSLLVPLSQDLGGASYVLLRRVLTLAPGARFAAFSMPVPPQDERALGELPLLALREGLSLERVQTLPAAGGRALHLTVGLPRPGDPAPLLPLFLYLALEFPAFTAGGVYAVLGQ